MTRHKILYKEGDVADRVFFVVSGEFKVTKRIVLIDKKLEEDEHQAGE